VTFKWQQGSVVVKLDWAHSIAHPPKTLAMLALMRKLKQQIDLQIAYSPSHLDWICNSKEWNERWKDVFGKINIGSFLGYEHHVGQHEWDHVVVGTLVAEAWKHALHVDTLDRHSPHNINAIIVSRNNIKITTNSISDNSYGPG